MGRPELADKLENDPEFKADFGESSLSDPLVTCYCCLLLRFTFTY